MIVRLRTLCAAIGALLLLSACGQNNASQTGATNGSPATQAPPESLPMGGAKSVTSFFVTSTGLGKGGDLGGLSGADAHCQALAKAEGSGDHTWRAYLSATATANQPAVNARDRIGQGPWYNSLGDRIAANLDQLHGNNAINKDNAVTERAENVAGVDEVPNRHDILTGSQPDGTAFSGAGDLTCSNWTSSNGGRAQVGHHDRMGQGEGASSWNSAHPSSGCSQQALQNTSGAGLFYCFAVD